MSKHLTDDEIITALMLQGSIRGAAAQLGIRERTIYERQKKPEFKALYRKARGDMLRLATAKVQKYTNAAIDVTLSIMADKQTNPAIRLQAAQTILSTGMKLTEQMDVIERLEELDTGGKEQ